MAWRKGKFVQPAQGWSGGSRVGLEACLGGMHGDTAGSRPARYSDSQRMEGHGGASLTTTPLQGGVKCRSWRWGMRLDDLARPRISLMRKPSHICSWESASRSSKAECLRCRRKKTPSLCEAAVHQPGLGRAESHRHTAVHEPWCASSRGRREGAPCLTQPAARPAPAPAPTTSTRPATPKGDRVDALYHHGTLATPP